MPETDNSLREFGAAIARVIRGESLEQEECRSLFAQVLGNTQPDLHQGAFIATLAAKGETAPEIAGAWQAIDEIDTIHVDSELPANLVENAGTGMDRLKTFNVSTAAALVAAAAGIPMARHGARALTSFCGTVDMAEALGVNVELDVEAVAASIRKAGIGLFNGMSPQVHPGALGRILSQIRFGSVLNISASLAHPAHPRLAVRGVHSPHLLTTVPEAMRETGFERAMIVHGFDHEGTPAIDELSILGKTHVRELMPDGHIDEYSLAPEDLGLSCCAYPRIAPTGNLQQEALRFVEVLADKGHAACQDFVCLNAAAILRVAGHTEDLAQGVNTARELIASHVVIEKLRAWVQAQNPNPDTGAARLETLLRQAGVSR